MDDEPLTGAAATEALLLYHRLAARKVRFNAQAVARAVRSSHGRALLAATLRKLSGRLPARKASGGRSPRPRPRPRLTRSCRVATAPGEPARPPLGGARA